LALALSLVIGCSDLSQSPADTGDSTDTELEEFMARPFISRGAVPPSPLETVQFGGQSLEFWPYTGSDFSGQGHDPVNLIFFGDADPRDIRAALLSLDGDRSAFDMPPMPPFNSTWDDAIGDVQVSYGAEEGWTGGVVQLACGDYAPLRFHLRLFKMGQWTVGNAHFEMIIPGTTDHQVLSWEIAEQFVIADFMRSGLLDPDVPMIPTQQINPSPWRTIPAVIYNEMPVELRGLIGGPLNDVEEDVPIATDGHAIILNLVDRAPRVVESRVQDFVVQFDQVIPKPFCASGPDDYVYVYGPVHLVQTTTLGDNGVYRSNFRAEGELTVTPINPLTGEPVGETLTAEVFEHHDACYFDAYQRASGLVWQHLMPDSVDGSGRLFTRLVVNSRGVCGYRADVRCGDNLLEEVSDFDKPAALQDPTIAPIRNIEIQK
jgi:hypothetical protein